MREFGFKNQILLRLHPEDLAAIAPKLELVDLKPRQELVRRNAPIDFVYFPECGQLSVLLALHHGEPR